MIETEPKPINERHFIWRGGKVFEISEDEFLARRSRIALHFAKQRAEQAKREQHAKQELIERWNQYLKS